MVQNGAIIGTSGVINVRYRSCVWDIHQGHWIKTHVTAVLIPMSIADVRTYIHNIIYRQL